MSTKNDKKNNDVNIVENDIKNNDEEKDVNPQKKRFWKSLLRLFIKILILILIGYILFGVIFGVKRMPTSYMMPNITEGDLLVYYRFEREYELGDVVYFKKDDKDYVMRIVAKPGQEVDISESGTFLIQGRPEVHLTYFDTKKVQDSQISFPYKVPEGHYFVMYDFRTQLGDSRYFGAIPAEEFIGRVIGRIQIRNI